LFDQRRFRLADIDGSGVTDIIYVRTMACAFTSISPATAGASRAHRRSFRASTTSPRCRRLGNGTACLAWTSALPGDARRSMRCVDLMGARSRQCVQPSVASQLCDQLLPIEIRREGNLSEADPRFYVTL
jgi:hypothetical protein